MVQTIEERKAKKSLCDKIWREKNKEKLEAYFKDYYLKNKDKRRKYDELNKDKRQTYRKEYCEKNKEQLNAKGREYNKKNKGKRKAHREATKEHNRGCAKRYRELNKDEIRLVHSEYYNQNKDRYQAYREAHREKQRKYAKIYYENNKPKIIDAVTKYSKTAMGKVVKSKCMARRRRDLEWEQLNNYAPEMAGHHLDYKNVIYIPEPPHLKNPHRQSDNESMLKINMFAWDYLEASSY